MSLITRLACLLLGHRPHYSLAPIEQPVTVQHSASFNDGESKLAGTTNHIVSTTPRLLVVVVNHGRRMEFDECARCGEIVRVHP